MGTFRYSTERFPLVVFTCPPRFDPDDTRETLNRYQREVLAARRTFALVVDATDVVELPNALVRRVITEWMKPVQELGEKQMVGMAMATPSALVRGAMTAINWVVPSRIPITFEATLADSTRWGLARLRERGVSVSDDVSRWSAALEARAKRA